MRLDVPAQIKTDRTTPKALAYVAIAVWIASLIVCLPALTIKRQEQPRTIRPLRFTQPPEGLTPSRLLTPRRAPRDVVAQEKLALSFLSPTSERERE